MGGRYLQILSGKDLYKQTIVVSAGTHDGVPLTFPARFPNIFVDYPLGQMHVGDKLWTNWNKASLTLSYLGGGKIRPPSCFSSTILKRLKVSS